MRQLVKKCRISFCPGSIPALFVALLFFFAWHPVHAGPASTPGKALHLDIRGLELLLQSDPNLMLVDVRTPEELSGPLGKISQSRNVPLQEIENNPEQFPRDKTLVLICRTGHRSLKASALLAEHGYVVYSVDGGMQAWREERPPPPSSEGALPRNSAVPGPQPDATKPQSPENEHRQLPGQNFFDNKMGC